MNNESFISRLAWFIGIWLVSVALLAFVAMAIRVAIL